MSMVKSESYDEVLKDLYEERNDLKKRLVELDNAISIIEQRRAKSKECGLSMFPEIEKPQFSPREFRNLSAHDSAVRILERIDRPATTTEIIDTILNHGFVTEAVKKRHSIRTSLTTSLNRKSCKLKRLPDKRWILKSEAEIEETPKD